jgi:hypothetical protein
MNYSDEEMAMCAEATFGDLLGAGPSARKAKPMSVAKFVSRENGRSDRVFCLIPIDTVACRERV